MPGALTGPYGWRMRRFATGVGIFVGLYLMVRAVAEPFVIDITDPATYRNDWGGPHLAGVLAVHCGPGIVAAVLLVLALIRRRRSRPVTRAQRSTRA
jgi:hypothetical protein